MARTQRKTRKRRSCGLIALLLGTAITAAPGYCAALDVFAGSASGKPLKEAAELFTRRTGEEVQLRLGGSGAMLAQMELTGRGDVYIPGSPDFMEAAVEKGLVDPATEVRVAYLIPVIAVKKGNPKNIHSLKDLAKPGLRVGLGRPDTVCVGLYGVEALERAGIGEAVHKNIVTQVESCEKTAQILSMGLVDAVLGWDVFAKWDPEHIAIVSPAPNETPRIAYIPAALVRTSKNQEKAREFLKLLDSPEGRALFSAEGYHTDLESARKAVGSQAPAGGRYPLPPAWK